MLHDLQTSLFVHYQFITVLSLHLHSEDVFSPLISKRIKLYTVMLATCLLKCEKFWVKWRRNVGKSARQNTDYGVRQDLYCKHCAVPLSQS